MNHLDKINGNAPDMVAVVQFEETKKILSILFNGKETVLKDGKGEVEYLDAKYPVFAEISDFGDLPNEEVFDGFESYMVGNITYSRPKFKPVEGRTFIGADVTLTVNGKPCKQDAYYDGKGSHIPCEDKTILDRYTFNVPVRYFTGRGKTIPADE